MAKRKRPDSLNLFLDKDLLEMHKGTCKKVMINPSKYVYVGRANQALKFSEKLNELIGVELAKTIRKCKYCYTE